MHSNPLAAFVSKCLSGNSEFGFKTMTQPLFEGRRRTGYVEDRKEARTLFEAERCHSAGWTLVSFGKHNTLTAGYSAANTFSIFNVTVKRNTANRYAKIIFDFLLARF